jgi:uncharacterized phage protein gp47/JayE
MQDNAPAGWRINLWLDLVLGAVARMVALLLGLAGQVPKAIYKDFLVRIIGLTQAQATAATGVVTVHASAGAGGTLAAGAQIDIDGIAFVTTTSTGAIAAAATATATVEAITPGTVGNDLTGTVVLLAFPTVTWIDTITLNAPTAGAVDGETDDEFVNRGADEMPTLSPKAIIADDAEVIARADPDVYRVLAINRFVPPSTSDVDGAIALYLQGNDGDAIADAGVKARVKATIEAGRILGITAYIEDPTETAVKISFQVQRYLDADATVVEDAARQAVKDLLDKLLWGVPDNDRLGWVDETTLRRNDIVVRLGQVPGVRHVTSVQLALAAGVLGTSDVTLAGPAALPTLTDLNLTSDVID